LKRKVLLHKPRGLRQRGQMIDELKSPKHQEKFKSQIEEILEAIECCYITLGSNYAEYGERYYKLTE
jgi:hypothetical protein